MCRERRSGIEETERVGKRRGEGESAKGKGGRMRVRGRKGKQNEEEEREPPVWRERTGVLTERQKG